MDQKLTHLETAFREFVEHESDHVAELQSQLTEVREGAKALKASIVASAQQHAGHSQDVEERFHKFHARLAAVEQVSASGGSADWESSRGRREEEDHSQVTTRRIGAHGYILVTHHSNYNRYRDR